MHQLECVVRGAAFAGRAAMTALGKLEPGQVCRLERNNHPKDRNAVKVLFMGVQIGWVPRELNKRLADAMDAGVEATAVCTRSLIWSARGTVEQEALIRITWE